MKLSRCYLQVCTYPSIDLVKRNLYFVVTDVPFLFIRYWRRLELFKPPGHRFKVNKNQTRGADLDALTIA